jgi:uncharacterized protein YprB with RNaseH-like and TPR domain
VDDLRAQLDALRARIRAVEARRLNPPPVEPLPGEESITAAGKHWETSTTSMTHGGFHFSRLEETPPDAFEALSEGAIPTADPARIAFLDTETTGLAGGAGTVPFLVGVGRLTPGGFTVRQYLMRDFEEEPSVLEALNRDLADADVLVTYNGRAYDEPLLATRYTLARVRPPFGRLAHLDLLYGARRLWKLRFDSCRLVELEAQILGFQREGDVPGHLIPAIWFDYIRTRRPDRIAGVLRHNALDILSLAALAAILPARFSNQQPPSHAGELVGLGRWLLDRGDRAAAIPLFEDAIRRIEFDRLPEARRRDVFVELAKHHERVTRDLARALEMAVEAAMLDEREAHQRRVARLRKRLDQLRLG